MYSDNIVATYIITSEADGIKFAAAVIQKKITKEQFNAYKAVCIVTVIEL